MATKNLDAEIRIHAAWETASENAGNAKASKLGTGDRVKDIKSSIQACKTVDLLGNEPVRTIHHLSCTGGTLFAKCIASMSNVLLLNEIDLQSLLPTNQAKSKFTPTDMVSLLRQGDPDISAELIERVFLNDLRTIHEDQWGIGRHLVLRDHSHSHFLSGPEVSQRPTLRELVQRNFEVRSIVTVRNPLDSWLSMVSHGWESHFQPATFNEYCRRYLLFLERYRDVPIVKFEDFVEKPESVMKQICEILDLEYFCLFQDVFSSFRFSGDSGRRSAQIGGRSRRDHSPDFLETAMEDPDYIELQKILSAA